MICLFFVFRIITVVSSRTVLNSIVRVHMNKLHYGHYTCKASNTAGTQEATIDIHSKYFCINVINIGFTNL